jgi:uncharacterized protein
MKAKTLFFLPVLLILASCTGTQGPSSQGPRNDHYITNQSPLVAQPYTALNLGDIKAEGWLLTMLERQSSGMTGHLDSIYELVCGPNNGWLGGDGDKWERGPYWIDGLLPLAYLLDDDDLKAKAQVWIEWSIETQRENGYFGPYPLPEDGVKIPGTQQGNSEDWWPKMVMLKVFQQYYSATQDERILSLLDKYFHYQLETLEEFPLGHWTYWGNRRGADNLAVVYWYYNIVKEPYLLELAELIHEQTFDWTDVYSGNMIRSTNPYPRLHCVNVSQGLKAPVIYYQQHPEQKYLDAVKLGLESLKDVHGFVTGMYGGDEHMHGSNPTQGSELCTATEMMFSFENILPISGDMYYADYLEKVAYNVLPTQHDDHFLRKQYFQQVNQVLINDTERNFYNDNNARICFGVLTGYPCCTCNMHQGWPKFVQNLWYATADNGLAALVYGPSSVKATVADGVEVSFTEETDYPFSDKIVFHFDADGNAEFPFHLRIPGWCTDPVVTVNGVEQELTEETNIVIIDRQWAPGDKVELTLPMEIEVSQWVESSVGIERGPLVYALKVEEDWKEVKTDRWEHSFLEVYPKSPWNYGLPRQTLEQKEFEITFEDDVADMPWNLESAPVSIKIKAARIPKWTLYQNSAGLMSVRSRLSSENNQELEEITLIPYGCSTLRIAQFPVVSGGR